MCGLSELLIVWSARALFCGYGFDDDAVRGFGIEGYVGPRDCFLHEGADGGIVEQGRRVEADVADRRSATLQEFLRIGDAGPVSKKEVHPLWIDRDGKEEFRGALGGSIADDQRVVVVVDEFERGGIELAHLRADSLARSDHLRRVFREEGDELLFGCFVFCFRHDLSR
jgi:hypothetical protein